MSVRLPRPAPTCTLVVALCSFAAGCIRPPPAVEPGTDADVGCAVCSDATVQPDLADATNPQVRVTHRKKLTVRAARVQGTHERFPVFVRTVDGDIAERVSDPSELRFAAPDGTPLPFDIERLTQDGHIEAWVRIPRISQTGDSDFYLEFLANPVPNQSAEEVWADYAAVYHLDDPSLADGAPITDSTVNGNDGVAVDTEAGSRTRDGVTGPAMQFDGSDDRIEIPDSPTFRQQDSFTLSAWVQFGDIASSVNVVSKPVRSVVDDTNDSWQVFLTSDEQMQTVTSHEGTSRPLGSSVLSQDTWHHVVLVFDGATLYHYVDGQEALSEEETGAVDYDGDPVLIGAELDGEAATAFFGGLIDEVRFTSRARDASWLANEFENGSKPGQFVIWGPLEAVND